ncbi:unnamed protein product, partial [Discosporangium mesarthrocarpum]
STSARVAPPDRVRPESDMWQCSSRLGVLRGSINSRALMMAFGWDRPVGGKVAAVQLSALSQKFKVGLLYRYAFIA